MKNVEYKPQYSFLEFKKGTEENSEKSQSYVSDTTEVEPVTSRVQVIWSYTFCYSKWTLSYVTLRCGTWVQQWLLSFTAMSFVVYNNVFYSLTGELTAQQ
jgi:hypothetical protein